MRATRVDIHDILHHDVIEEESVHGAIAALDEHILEPALVQPLHAFLAPVARPEELDVRVRVVGEHVDNFIVEAFVEVVAILEMGLADLCLICVEYVSGVPFSGWV